MPTYDYLCDNCGYSFERMQRFSEEPIKECPECHQLKVRRVIHPTGIIFKGSGWYVTDHGRGSSGGRPAPGNGGTKKEKAEESPKADSSTTSEAPKPKPKPVDDGD